MSDIRKELDRLNLILECTPCMATLDPAGLRRFRLIVRSTKVTRATFDSYDFALAYCRKLKGG